jgi:hypothetical protein
MTIPPRHPIPPLVYPELRVFYSIFYFFRKYEIYDFFLGLFVRSLIEVFDKLSVAG